VAPLFNDLTKWLMQAKHSIALEKSQEIQEMNHNALMQIQEDFLAQRITNSEMRRRVAQLTKGSNIEKPVVVQEDMVRPRLWYCSTIVSRDRDGITWDCYSCCCSCYIEILIRSRVAMKTKAVRKKGQKLLTAGEAVLVWYKLWLSDPQCTRTFHQAFLHLKGEPTKPLNGAMGLRNLAVNKQEDAMARWTDVFCTYNEQEWLRALVVQAQLQVRGGGALACIEGGGLRRVPTSW
jgi:hypothetical protein